MKLTGMLPDELEATKRSAEQFLIARDMVIKRSLALFDAKGEEYDQGMPIWYKHPFGDVSFAQETVNCVLRAVSLLRKGDEPAKLQETIDDLLVYTWAWLAWRLVQGNQYAPETDRFLHKETLSEPVPPRPPDTTGPGPKPVRPRLSLRRRAAK